MVTLLQNKFKFVDEVLTKFKGIQLQLLHCGICEILDSHVSS